MECFSNWIKSAFRWVDHILTQIYEDKWIKSVHSLKDKIKWMHSLGEMTRETIYIATAYLASPFNYDYTTFPPNHQKFKTLPFFYVLNFLPNVNNAYNMALSRNYTYDIIHKVISLINISIFSTLNRKESYIRFEFGYKEMIKDHLRKKMSLNDIFSKHQKQGNNKNIEFSFMMDQSKKYLSKYGFI